ncbi:MAG TPA: acylphosphatase [Stellaceae bacterium]|jgi:acylphosphatase|nr:acylphosphatase [Stellaceae bacterium]
MTTVRLRITGRVQGVGYRAWAVQKGTGLSLSGWVCNRRDGSVEALVSGTDDAVAEMIAACREGPYAARVSNVSTEDTRDDGSVGFSAKATV